MNNLTLENAPSEGATMHLISLTGATYQHDVICSADTGADIQLQEVQLRVIK
jgi:hypothetical protein